MTTILDTLMEAFDSDIVSPEQEALKKELRPILDPVDEKLSRKESDEFWSAVSALQAIDNRDYFVLGYRLGVQLTLAGLGQIC